MLSLMLDKFEIERLAARKATFDLLSESAAPRIIYSLLRVRTVDKRCVRCEPGTTAKRATNQVSSRGFAFQADAPVAA